MIDKKLKISEFSVKGIVIIICFVYTLNIQPVVSGADNFILPTIEKNYNLYFDFFNSFENYSNLLYNYKGLNRNYTTFPFIMHLIILIIFFIFGITL